MLLFCYCYCYCYGTQRTVLQVMVSMMLTYQPFYIGGIEDLEQAKKNTYGGVGTFLFVFILSVVYLVLDALRGGGDNNNNSRGDNTRRHGGMDYEGVPTSSMGGPDLMLETTTNLELPPSVEQAHFT